MYLYSNKFCMSNYPDKQKLIEDIGKVSLFAKADHSILERLADKTKIVMYKGGDTIIRKGGRRENDGYYFFRVFESS